MSRRVLRELAVLLLGAVMFALALALLQLVVYGHVRAWR